MSYTWTTPTKTVWPASLTYTATEKGTAYFSVTVTRQASVTAGQLQGSVLVTRASADLSGPADKVLTVNTPSVELWQVNGYGASLARVSSAACIFDGGAATANLNAPGSAARCTYTFSPPFAYDPELTSELRISSITFGGGVTAASGFLPFGIDAWGISTGATSRCVSVTDTFNFPTSADRPTPYSVGNVICTTTQSDYQGRPPTAPSSGLEVCVTTTFKYSCTFPSTTCLAAGITGYTVSGPAVTRGG
ncbi:hypothetical protein MNEG_16301 [Monoraphidium neglectum]|uniref:Uncharacterized protein n=1 Tax=Monoraphidium neglectum TaxID=145388 RepID=A0A0D2K699_9CHLO|nr:hypothetical protein MNEG_16301 [Monoraphidium neglectum]KIY91663.1 hypothetical protein MNEG_16301 [Monoraphidium neglectum]|eukprot:XP_013890683.1 hypothetical protein MNEG_16301 [Monoraphidium neglectum]